MSIVAVVQFKGKEGQGDAILEWFKKNAARITAALLAEPVDGTYHHFVTEYKW